jgi:hypothetical protein
MNPIKVHLKPRPSFFKRHSKLLSIVGALVVFTTFVVKDKLKDAARDSAESIRAAKTFFQLHQESNAIRFRLITVEAHLSTIDRDVRKIPNCPDAPGPFQDDDLLFLEHDSTADLRNAVDNLSAFAGTIDQPNNASVAKLKLILGDLDEIEQLRLQAAFAANREHNPEKAASLNDKVSNLRDRISLNRGQYIADYGLQHAVDEILAEANVRQKKYDERSRSFGYASNFLFVFGWGLGLAGQLFSNESNTAKPD